MRPTSGAGCALPAHRVRLCEVGNHLSSFFCAGMTKRAVEEYLVVLSPRPLFEPSIRKLPSGGETSGKPRKGGEERGTFPEEREGSQETSRAAPSPGGANPRHGPPARPGLVEPARSNSPPCSPPEGAEVYNFRFAAGRGFREKLERLSEVLGIEDPARSLATVLDRALDLALEKKDPRRRQERRLEREYRREATPAESRPGEVLKKEEAREKAPVAFGGSSQPGGEAEGKGSAPARSRYIPRQIRDRVLERAGYRCEYSGPDGTRCTSRTGLEIEHERPFALFRSHDERHLLAFCRRHNGLSAERTYGAEFIRGKIEEKRRRAAALLGRGCGHEVLRGVGRVDPRSGAAPR